MPTQQGNVSLPGSGSLSATLRAILPVIAAFGGSGTLQSNSKVFSFANPARFGSLGSLTATIQTNAIIIFPKGAGDFLVLSTALYTSMVPCAGIGAMLVSGVVRLGPPGAASNIVVPGPGPTNNLVI